MSRGRRDPREAQGQHETPAAPDVPAILTTLIKRAVSFVVIGGVAVAHHGYVRATRDIDIVPGPNEENLGRLWNALLEMEAHPLSLGDFRPEKLPAPSSSHRRPMRRTSTLALSSSRASRT
jgi:hypothetical protein